MSYNPYGIGNTLNFNNTYNTMNNFAIENQSNHWIDYKDDYSISKNSSDHSVDNVNDDDPFDLDDDDIIDNDFDDNFLEEKKIVIKNSSNYNFNNNNFNLPFNTINNNMFQFNQPSFYNNNSNINLNSNMNYNNNNFINQKFSPPNDIDKLNIANKVLKQANNELRNENKVLEVELKNYESQTKNLSKTNSIFSKFDQNLQTFIYNLKDNLKQMIDKNLELMDSITSIEEQSNKIKKENQDLFSKYGDQIISIENSSRKNAEIEISNLQNEKNIIIYQDNYNELNDYLEKLKLQLDNLKSKENDLNLLKESCEQRRNDNNDLIKKLKNTIKSLNGVNESNLIKGKDNNLQFDTDDNNLYSKDSQIKKLNDIILKITEDQKKISEINEKMKMQIDNKFEDKKDLLIKEKNY